MCVLFCAGGLMCVLCCPGPRIICDETFENFQELHLGNNLLRVRHARVVVVKPSLRLMLGWWW